MQKIVTNRCHGGFGLSHEAVLEYARQKGIRLYPEHDGKPYGFWTYWTVPEAERPESEDDWNKWTFEQRRASIEAHDAAQLCPREIPRDDTALVATVETMGAAASGKYSKLEVTEIPDGVDWDIGEYDGLEWVAEKHRTW